MVSVACCVFAVSYLIALTLVIASTTYGAISNTLQYLADRGEQPRPIRHTITYTFPATQAEICDNFRAKLQELKSQYPNVTFSDTPPDSQVAVKADKTGNKFVAVIDAITSNPGWPMPWKEMVQICKEEGVWSVIDAAHSIGQEVSQVPFVRQCCDLTGVLWFSPFD